MTDPDQPGEALDDEVIEGFDEYPPDQALGLDDDEEEPEVELVADAAGLSDEEDELVGEGVPTGREIGPLAPDDEFSGDETSRDVATEHVAPPAEEAAIRLDDEP